MHLTLEHRQALGEGGRVGVSCAVLRCELHLRTKNRNKNKINRKPLAVGLTEQVNNGTGWGTNWRVHGVPGRKKMRGRERPRELRLCVCYVCCACVQASMHRSHVVLWRGNIGGHSQNRELHTTANCALKVPSGLDVGSWNLESLSFLFQRGSRQEKNANEQSNDQRFDERTMHAPGCPRLA